MVSVGPGTVCSRHPLVDEPAMRRALALLLGALGLSLAIRHARLGLCIGGAALALASGFAVAKFRTEWVREPVLAHELRYAEVSGFVEAHELRDKGRARVTLRVLTLDGLNPDDMPYRVRISMSAKQATDARIGQAVTLRATLQPPTIAAKTTRSPAGIRTATLKNRCQ
jgi:competence protein ComEC